MNVEELKASKNRVLKEFGKIDGLVNAAGGNQPEGVLMPDQDDFSNEYGRNQESNGSKSLGNLNSTQIFGEAIVQTAGKGSIVNISSMNSKRAITRVLGYNMGKAAVDCYTQWFAVEMANRYGDKIRMNALAPGFFLTEQNKNLLIQEDGSYTERGKLVIQQTPFKRFGHPDELKGALVWLLGDDSQFVTGAMICVDGGFSIFGGV